MMHDLSQQYHTCNWYRFRIIYFGLGHSTTTWTKFYKILTTYLFRENSFGHFTYFLLFVHLTKRGIYTDYIPTSSCSRSSWMPPYRTLDNSKSLYVDSFCPWILSFFSKKKNIIGYISVIIYIGLSFGSCIPIKILSK